jgi:hypothetical protein
MSILIRFKKTRDCDQAIKNYNDFNYIKSKMRDIFKNICLNNEKYSELGRCEPAIMFNSDNNKQLRMRSYNADEIPQRRQIRLNHYSSFKLTRIELKELKELIVTEINCIIDNDIIAVISNN